MCSLAPPTPFADAVVGHTKETPMGDQVALQESIILSAKLLIRSHASAIAAFFFKILSFNVCW